VRQTTVISGFLAERAWSGLPELTQLIRCTKCGFQFFERGISDQEATNLYRDYRDIRYFLARNRWEPFYTRAQHETVVAWSRSTTRSDNLVRLLKESGLPQRFEYALDHGGAEGHLLSSINAERKIVFDLSGSATIKGVVGISDEWKIPFGCDFLISCQVLEHTAKPAEYLTDLLRHCSEHAYLYIEVPDERWSSRVFPGRIRDAWLRLLLRHHWLLRICDVVSTICRVKFKFLPPLGFIPMREHLNYFTLQSLIELLSNLGLKIVCSGHSFDGQLFAIIQLNHRETS
jgi:hypothetical protein